MSRIKVIRRKRRVRPLRLLGLIVAALIAAPIVLSYLIALGIYLLGHLQVVLAVSAVGLAVYTIVTVAIRTLRSLHTVRDLQ